MEKKKWISSKIQLLLFGLILTNLGGGIFAFINYSYQAYILAGLALTSLALLFFLFRIVNKQQGEILQNTGILAEGKLNTPIPVNDQSIFSMIKDNINRVVLRINLATEYMQRIGEGEDIAGLQIDSEDRLGKALSEMSKKMRQIEEEEKKRTWVIEGLAKFSGILRSESYDLQALSFQIISHLVKYVGANQGGLFIEQEEESGEKYLELMASYAYEKRKFLEKKIYAGEGLLGQCILEKDSIYHTIVPENYVHITSGLGNAPPRNLIIIPLRVNEVVYGAVELASFQQLEAHHMEFLHKVTENIAATVASVKVNAHTQQLLEASQKLTAELKSQEEVMRQNMEELSATQEEMLRKEAELKSHLKAIDITISTVEFDLEGNITDVNELYLGINGFEKGDLIGKNYTILLSEGEKAKPQTQMMWDGLRSGQSFSGEFKNVNKIGKEMWFIGTYSPIFDLHGKPNKVVLFAQFTTHEKEKQKDLMGGMNALISSVPILEITVNSKIKLANDIFINLLGYKKLEVVRKELNMLLTPESQEKTNKLLTSLVQEGGFYETHLYFIKGNREKKCFRTTFTAIKSLDDKVYKIIVLLLDAEEASA